MNFTPHQQSALDAVQSWLSAADRPWFYLAGFAGTGKTTLARHFAAGLDGRVCFASFTGKAASVMRSRGCEGATTIHRLIYRTRDKCRQRLLELQRELAVAEEDGPLGLADRLRREVAEEARAVRSPSFVLDHDSPLRSAALVVIDECSMVGEKMARDLLSFGTPVLALGDPAQLPPVFGQGFFTSGEPDFLLTEVHRQAQESGILRLATEIREDAQLRPLDYGDARVVRRGELSSEEIMSHDQVLVGRNKTRRATNARWRQLAGRTSPWPEKGERLVCLRNCHDLDLLNGEVWEASADAEENVDGTLLLSIRNQDLDVEQEVVAWRDPFMGRDLDAFEHDKDVQELDWGYVLSVHKSQGSEFPSVIVFDESHVFGANARRWLYTAVSRASEKLTVVV